jgi:hypothetical protein
MENKTTPDRKSVKPISEAGSGRSDLPALDTVVASLLHVLRLAERGMHS